MERGRPRLYDHPTCHTDRPHFARGLCKSCYNYQSRSKPRFGGAVGWRKPYFDGILGAQGGVCAVCRVAPESDGRHRFVLYRPHTEPSASSVLCIRCSTFVGFLEGTPDDVLARALVYAKGGDVSGMA